MGNSLQCTSTSKKLYVLVEPPSYNEKYVEPVHRKEEESIPYRESELEIIKTFDQTRITIAKEPVDVPASFTIIKPAGFNFSVVFYKLPDIYQTLAAFFKQSLNQGRRIPQRDAEKRYRRHSWHSGKNHVL